jgi:hypothetical protein
MIIVSLVLNILVLIPVTASIIGSVSWTAAAYGGRSAARDILLAIYLAILAASVALLIGVTLAPSDVLLTGAVAALLAVQVVYKVLTGVTVRARWRNPVVISNFAIAAVHLVTIVTIVLSR